MDRFRETTPSVDGSGRVPDLLRGMAGVGVDIRDFKDSNSSSAHQSGTLDAGTWVASSPWTGTRHRVAVHGGGTAPAGGTAPRGVDQDLIAFTAAAT